MLEKGLEFQEKGKNKEAFECFQKCVDVTPEMAYQVILALRQLKVEYIVAPYEADAQLTFLTMHGYVDAVITEDSDLIAYGCEKVLFC